MKHLTTLVLALLMVQCSLAQDIHMNESGEKVKLTDEMLEEGEFTLVEVMPEYPGGVDALVQWVANELEYPKEAKKKKIEGVVYIQFVVGKDGSIENAFVQRGVHPLLDEEALRVVKSIKGYTPGYQKGKPVRVQFTFPLRFQL